jgi:hypothetical protein
MEHEKAYKTHAELQMMVTKERENITRCRTTRNKEGKSDSEARVQAYQNAMWIIRKNFGLTFEV